MAYGRGSARRAASTSRGAIRAEPRRHRRRGPCRRSRIARARFRRTPIPARQTVRAPTARSRDPRSPRASRHRAGHVARRRWRGLAWPAHRPRPSRRLSLPARETRRSCGWPRHRARSPCRAARPRRTGRRGTSPIAYPRSACRGRCRAARRSRRAFRGQEHGPRHRAARVRREPRLTPRQAPETCRCIAIPVQGRAPRRAACPLPRSPPAARATLRADAQSRPPRPGR